MLFQGDKLIEFGRPPVWNCPMPETEEEHKKHEDEEDDIPAASIKKVESSVR